MSNKTYLLGLLGYPLGHTLSPLMHGISLKSNNLEGVYVPFEIEPANFKQIAKTIKYLPFNGLNVTVPYKEKIIPFLDEIKEEAKIIGAVNTIQVTSKLIGHNTDSYGFRRSLKDDLNFNPKNKVVFLLGAGGASRACLYALAKAGASSIYIADCDKKKADNLKKHFSKFFAKTEFKVVEANNASYLKYMQDIDLLVNATPIGLKKTDPLIVPKEILHNKLYVYDLVYNPAKTKLLKTAEEKGAKIASGIGMLIHQGAKAFELWTGKKADIEKIQRTFKNIFNKKG